MLEKTLESPLDCKQIKPVNPIGNQSWIFIGRTDAEAETPILWPPDAKNWLTGKDPDAGKDWRQEEKGMAEDEMVGWHHRLDGHEFEQALGVGDGQGGLACCSPWGRRESDTTKRLNWTELLVLMVPRWGPQRFLGHHMEKQEPQGCSGSQVGWEGCRTTGSCLWKGTRGDPGASLRGSSLTESAGVKELCLFYVYTISIEACSTRTAQSWECLVGPHGSAPPPPHSPAGGVSTSPPIQGTAVGRCPQEQTVLLLFQAIKPCISPLENRIGEQKLCTDWVVVWDFWILCLVGSVRYTSKY